MTWMLVLLDKLIRREDKVDERTLARLNADLVEEDPDVFCQNWKGRNPSRSAAPRHPEAYFRPFIR